MGEGWENLYAVNICCDAGKRLDLIRRVILIVTETLGARKQGYLLTPENENRWNLRADYRIRRAE